MNMENFDDGIFEDDEFDEISGEQLNNGGNGDNSPANPQQPSTPDEDDLTTEVLRLKGIADPEKIKFEDETGAIIERPWNSLSKAEQLNILASQEDDDTGLDESELELINSIRESGLSIKEYMESLVEPVAPQPKRYKVDELTDDELYALDLLEKVGSDNITDEEITQAIELAKQHEVIFKKTVEGLRNEYIRLQEDEEAQLANERAAEQEAQYEEFAASIQSEIRGLNSFAGLPLELADDDMEDLSTFILDLDDSGTSSFGKALNDPALFTRAAFWTLNEDKIVEELTKQMQDNYKRGYEAAKQDLQGKPRVVYNSPQKPQQSQFMDDIVDDEEW